MIVEARKTGNGFFIPMIEQLKSIQKEYILMNIELTNEDSESLERKHRRGYLRHSVNFEEFNDWTAISFKKMTGLPQSVQHPARLKQFKMYNRDELHDRKDIY